MIKMHTPSKPVIQTADVDLRITKSTWTKMIWQLRGCAAFHPGVLELKGAKTDQNS